MSELNPSDDTSYFSIFRTFSKIGQALELRELLENHGIETEMGDNSSQLDNSFGANHALDQVEVRIDIADFEKAEKIIADNAKDLLENISEDYYLFQFSDDELYEILERQDEWNAFDIQLAQKLLSERGKPVDEATIQALRNDRIESLAKPEKDQKGWIIAGYIFAILGGFLGLIIGYFLWTSKKTLPNGVQVYSYSEKNRKHGQYIFLISIIIFPLSILMRSLGAF